MNRFIRHKNLRQRHLEHRIFRMPSLVILSRRKMVDGAAEIIWRPFSAVLKLAESIAIFVSLGFPFLAWQGVGLFETAIREHDHD